MNTMLSSISNKLKIAVAPASRDCLGIIHKISVSRILPNPAQPRKVFDSEATVRLADSIRRHGILQPLTLRALSGEAYTEGYSGMFELVAGERRLRAAKLIGLTDVPCIIIEVDSCKSAELAIIENLLREDLDMFEEASAISSLIEIYGLTQEQIAAKLSCSQSYIANKLRILRLSARERDVIKENHMTERHARALIRISDVGKRIDTTEFIAQRGYNVAQTEEYISRICDAEAAEKKPKPIRTFLLKDIKIFYNTIDRAITLVRSAGINVISEKNDEGDEYELTIKIPKRQARASRL